MNSIEKKIAQNLKKLRNLLDITQVKFAESVEVTNSYISAIEKGKAKNISNHIFNSIEKIYGINRKILEEGSFEDVEEAIKKWLDCSEANQKSLHVAQSESEYDKHGGWKPQTEETDWGYIPKVVKIVESDTIYSKALLQNIDAFYQAVKDRKEKRKFERRTREADHNEIDRRQKNNTHRE